MNIADGNRSVRSAKYETPFYNKTQKTKYLIGSIHLTSLVSGTLPSQQTERLIANRFINLSGGKNSNMALDEYVELVNRETKNSCSGYQTKESIIAHSKEFPLLIKAVKILDIISDIHRRKGFHHIPSYRTDVQKVILDLFDIDGFSYHEGRKLKCRQLVQNSNPFADSHKQLVNMIYRHKPLLPFRRNVINIINHKGNDMMFCDSFVIALKAATCEIIFISFEHFWKTIPSMHYNFMTDTSSST